MSSLASLFQGVNFQHTIRRYCDQIGWRVRELSDNKAVLGFNMKSGRTQTLYILSYETTLEFSVPSGLSFDADDDIPHVLSTLLLKRNAEAKIGFWCIEQIGSKYVYSCMHNAEMSLLDTDYFGRIVVRLVEECDDFEGVLLRMIRG